MAYNNLPTGFNTPQEGAGKKGEGIRDLKKNLKGEVRKW
jgi:hypothetical protein